MTERPAGADPRCPDSSFTEIFESYTPFLWRAAVGLGVPEAEADDLCQEVMLIVHRKLPEFDGRALRSWLYKICLRVASDYRRSARVRRERPTDVLPEIGFSPTQADEFEGRRVEQRLTAVLGELDADKRAVFVLFEIEELTLREIAEVVEAPLQTVYSRLQAARAHVRSAFARVEVTRDA